MAVPPPPTKAALRRVLKERRQAFVSELSYAERCAAYVGLSGRVFPALQGAERIAAYLPIGAEIDPLPLIAALAAAGRCIALPHVTGPQGALRFLGWEPGAPLDHGPLNIRQPPADAPEITPQVILTPLLGFDADLHRIGYGAGHYDRAFAAHPAARRIGLAWSCQRVDALPRDAWDAPLHAIATEREWMGA